MTPDQLLSSWREKETSVRSRLLAPGIAPRGQVFGMSGMEVFEAIFSGALPPAPIGDSLDFIPVHMETGVAIFQGRPQLRHYNPLGTVHGGWFCTLLDSAVGCAVHTTLPAGKGYTTLELKVNMLRPLTDAVPLVRAEGKVSEDGRLADIEHPACWWAAHLTQHARHEVLRYRSRGFQ